MHQDQLSHAAIALQQVLDSAGIKFGIFGESAVTAYGGARESKDIDCVAQVTKEEAISLLDEKNDFAVIPQTDQDYVAFFWVAPGDSPDNGVLVKIFPYGSPGANSIMDTSRTIQLESQELKLGSPQSTFVDPFDLYASKLCAAGTREMSHDSADLRVLMALHGDQIRTIPKI